MICDLYAKIQKARFLVKFYSLFQLEKVHSVRRTLWSETFFAPFNSIYFSDLHIYYLILRFNFFLEDDCNFCKKILFCQRKKLKISSNRSDVKFQREFEVAMDILLYYKCIAPLPSRTYFKIDHLSIVPAFHANAFLSLALPAVYDHKCAPGVAVIT